MSTYSGDCINALQQAVESLFNQHFRPDDVVIVSDGPLTISQQAMLDALIAAYPQISQVRLSHNVGRGRARNEAIRHTRHELVFIMDSDDIALPHRFSTLIQAFVDDHNLGFVCGWAREFDDQSGSTVSIKRCPESDAAIRKAIRFTNVICNPTCGFRKSLWQQSGGFPDFRDINEDHLYYLRLAAIGCKFRCVQEVVLDFRINRQLYARRRGWRVFRSDLRFRRNCIREGHNYAVEALGYLAIFAARRFAPAFLGTVMQKAWRAAGR